MAIKKNVNKEKKLARVAMTKKGIDELLRTKGSASVWGKEGDRVKR